MQEDSSLLRPAPRPRATSGASSSAGGRRRVGDPVSYTHLESCGERVKEAIGHIRGNGYHFGKSPYGSKAVPSPENPRYRIQVDDPEEQIVLSRIKSMIEARVEGLACL